MRKHSVLFRFLGSVTKLFYHIRRSKLSIDQTKDKPKPCLNQLRDVSDLGNARGDLC